MAKIEINGALLDYADEGAGDPVVFVHGSMSDQRTWEGQSRAFSKRFRVIVYSRRYHWPNETIPDGADYVMLEQVDDLEELIRALEIAPAHLVGNSYGAYISLLVAIRRPELVRSLVLAEPPVIPLFTSVPPKLHQILRLFATRPRTAVALTKFIATGIGPATAAFRRGDSEAAMQTFLRAVLGREAFERIPEERMEQARSNVFPAEFLGSGFAPLTADQVRNVQTPTLLVTGERSPSILIRATDRLEELLPHAERVEITEASHGMHEDNPQAFDAAVSAFLEKVTQSA